MVEESHDQNEQPRKRIRLHEPAHVPAHSPIPFANSIANPDDARKEIKAGITEYVCNTNPGFSGVLKQRYTDFLVNEILSDGTVLHLEDVAVPEVKKTRKLEGQERVGEIRSSGPSSLKPPLPEEKSKNEDDATKENDATEENAEPDSTKPEELEIRPEDRDTLEKYFGKSVRLILSLYSAVLKNPHRKRRDFRPVTTSPILDKYERTEAHQAIRRIFSSQLESSTGSDNSLMISASSRPANKKGAGRYDRDAGANLTKGRLGWEELGGEYLHFTLYKENKDTMEVLYYFASHLKLAIKNFQFSGTKDRRAVTVQRVAANRVQSSRLAGIARSFYGAKIGGFKYENTGLSLGQLLGNEFCITLRDCHFPDEESLSPKERIAAAQHLVQSAVENLKTKGFINYFGLQRFGSFAASTDEIGKKMLRGELEAAVQLILSYNPSDCEEPELMDTTAEAVVQIVPGDDRRRAQALHTWETTQDSRAALSQLPRKFSAEHSIIRHLGLMRGERRPHAKDWQGALASIQRNLRLMYVHAYQSLVWNEMAGERWRHYGDKVVEGDLVIVEKGDPALNYDDEANVDAAGEVIVRPAPNDSAAAAADPFTRARPLSREEAESGRWSVWDIVLPLPGYDVVYPANEVGEAYVKFMGSERGGGLNPHDMRRKWKDISLSGGYRRVIAKPGGMRVEVKGYKGENEQLVETDWDRLKEKVTEHRNGMENEDMPETAEAGSKPLPGEHTAGGPTVMDVEQTTVQDEKIAVVLRMQLGSSQYATMALRELMKAGGVRHFRPEMFRER